MSLSGTNGRVPYDEEVGFLPTSKDSPDTNENEAGQKDTYRLLTREDLMQLDSKEPLWLRLRWGLFILFWIVWIGLLLAAILIIVFTPKCPPRPVLPFWRSSAGYWVNPFAYADSTGDKIGDLRGLVERLGYIKSTIGAGFIVLSSIFSGQFTNDQKTLGLVDDFYTIDPAAGTMEDFKYFVRSCHKNGIHVVLTMDFNSVSAKHSWTDSTSMLEPYPSGGRISRLGGDARTVIQGTGYYSVLGSQFVDLNLRESVTLDRVSLGSKWFAKYPTSQIYLNESVEVVRRIRKVVDEMSESSGKPKKASPTNPLVINNNILTYDMLSVDDRDSMALAAASTTDPRQSDLVALASTFLLPGTCLLYYGSELNEETRNTKFTADFYPFDEKTVFTGSNETDVLLSQLAMPWDQSGVGFSAMLSNVTSFTEYLKAFKFNETVESATSSGRGITSLSLVQDLVAIRKNESLLWGGFRMLQPSRITEELNFEIFERKAEGFPAFIIVLRKESNAVSGTFDFSSVCPSIIPKIIYPPNRNFPIDQPVSSQRVYLKSDGQPMIYVFKCE
uniref:Trehalose-6-phosphate hydrolase n=1 Tax=Schistosoma haematobium TaxID=6185 RepID=A0A095A6A0_SCHHA